MYLQIKSAPKVLLFVIATITTLMMAKNTRATTDLRNETDRVALMNIKLQISNDPQGVLNSWNDFHHHCFWEGVTCNVRHQRVTNLTLEGKNLFGPISPYIGNLSFLKSINLGNNRFHGEIPPEIGRLFRLRNLNISINGLGGEIPVNLSQCSELRFMELRKNRLVGKIPSELGSLNKLVYIDLFENNLTKEIPPSIGNLSSLGVLSLSFNNLEGNLPNEIGNLRNLWGLSIGTNKFSGLVPPSIYNISTMSMFSLPENFLEGELPNDIGMRMPNLQLFYIGINQFTGNIPTSIANATNLEGLDLGRNKFQGPIPINLGNLRRLQMLNIGDNLLGGNTNGNLDFITSLTNCSNLQSLDIGTNNFGGQLPQIIGNLSGQVRYLTMQSNRISGYIPISLMTLANLYLLSMEDNFFTGTMPRDFSKLHFLQGLALNNNLLNGEIPSSFCNLTSLYELHLNNNYLEGTLPQCLGNMTSLKILYVSKNKLSGIIHPAIFSKSFAPTQLDLSLNTFLGSLPPEVGRLANIIGLDVSYNNFSGQIPRTLGDCTNLQILNMQSNFFGGTIPPKFNFWKAIEHLDLSRNNLSGQIPKDLESLPSLNYLNLSFNNFDGEVPRNGVFGNSSQIILNGNHKLCGGVLELQLPSCHIHHYKKKNWNHLIIIVGSLVSFFILISITLLCWYQRRYQKSNSSNPILSGKEKFLRISYHEIQCATEGFSQENIVGSGNFGVVYKGKLDEQGNKLVAVKVLNLQKAGVSKSFKTECNALRNIRHRNIVSLLSYCSSIDTKGNDFSALIYDFMENGSLEMWVHPRTSEEARMRNLNLLQRLNIAIDVASALQYLHHHCGFIIAHCDLKPSNILLNKDLTAHVGDFGLARLLSNGTLSTSRDGTSTSAGIRGTIGYAAPEYAMGCEATIQGDVYSYGIVLLEMFTGKRPTDEMFTSNLNLHNYVEESLNERDENVFDPWLNSKEGDEIREVESNHHDGIIDLERSCGRIANFWSGNNFKTNFIISILRIGLKCSQTSPNDRMDMNDVTRQLLAIKDDFLRGPTR